MPLVSVILPTYNRAHIINKSIQSVLTQTFTNFELIIVDDGSTDNTKEIVQNIKDDRIVYIHCSTNRGASSTRNVGINAAKGTYIAFQDSDDEWVPEKLKTQIDVMMNCPPNVGVVYSGFLKIEPDKTYYIPKSDVVCKDGNVHYELLKHNFIGTPTVLLKKECIIKTKMFDENLLALEDWDLWIEISKCFHFKYISKPLLYSFYSENSVNTIKNNVYNALEKIIEKNSEDFSTRAEIVSKHYFKLGLGLYLDNKFKDGTKYIHKSLKIYHWDIKIIILATIIYIFGDGISLKIIKFNLKINEKLNKNSDKPTFFSATSN